MPAETDELVARAQEWLAARDAWDASPEHDDGPRDLYFAFIDAEIRLAAAIRALPEPLAPQWHFLGDKSSTIAAARHNKSSGTLDIQFKFGTGGEICSYQEVPRGTYEALIAAESPGGYHFANIKDVFKWTKA